MATVTCYATNKSGYTSTRGTWATARGASSGNDAYGNNAGTYRLYAAYIPWLSTYGIARDHLIFDTSAIPVGATITNVDLNFRKINADGGTRYTHAVESTKSPTDDMVASDYSKVGSTTYGNVNTTASGDKTIVFNSTGKSAIVQGGYTKIALRIDKDLDNVTPTDYDENGNIGGDTNATESYRPNIVVTYTLPFTPTPMMHMMGMAGGIV